MDGDTCDLLCLDLPHAEAVRAQLDDSSQVQAKALAHPTRLRIAAALRLGGELCVCDLAWITELAPNLVSHHVRVLPHYRPGHLPPQWQAGLVPADRVRGPAADRTGRRADAGDLPRTRA